MYRKSPSMKAWMSFHVPMNGKIDVNQIDPLFLHRFVLESPRPVQATRDTQCQQQQQIKGSLYLSGSKKRVPIIIIYSKYILITEVCMVCYGCMKKRRKN